MSNLSRWDSLSDWLTWTRENGGEFPRIISEKIKLPYKRINHIGSGDSGTPADTTTTPITAAIAGENKAIWRLGQFFADGDDRARRNQMDYGDLNDRLTHAITPPVQTETSEFGLSSPGRNGFAIIGDDEASGDTSIISYPRAGLNFYVGFWFRSVIDDYSDDIGYLILHQDSPSADIGFAVFIDTDNLIKASIFGSTQISLTSSVTVDTDWHYVLLASNAPGSAAHYLIVDNVIEDQQTAVAATTSTFSEHVFSVSGPEVLSSSLGFSGFIDEIIISEWSGSFNGQVNNTKYETVIIRSPVIDTQDEKSILSRINAVYDAPDNSSVTFSARASNSSFDVTSDDVDWTGFTDASQVPTGTDTSTISLGLGVKGRYQQLRIKLSPSLETDNVIRKETPELDTVEAVFSTETQSLILSNPAYIPGTILGQSVAFSGIRAIDKVSLNLTLENKTPKTFIEGQSGAISFQAANFRESRDETVFQPLEHFRGPLTWQTSGTTISNSLQTDSYIDQDDVLLNAPFLEYQMLFVDEGVYNLWGYGYTAGEIFWSFDEDDTHIRSMQLGSQISGFEGQPRWTRFGQFFAEANSIHDFRVYLAENNDVILDQWYFTTATNLQEELDLIDNGVETPLPLSPSPFNTVLKLRHLKDGKFHNDDTTIDIDTIRTTTASGTMSFDDQTDKLYFIQTSDSLRRMSSDGSNEETLLSRTFFAVAVDVSNREVYWWESSPNRLLKAGLDSTFSEEIIGPITGTATLSYIHSNRYYYVAATLPIRRINLDGTDDEIVIAGTQSISAMAIDKGSSKIYWSNTTDGILERADLDGSNRETVMTYGLFSFNDIEALDVLESRREIYAGTDTGEIIAVDMNDFEIKSTLGDLNTSIFAMVVDDNSEQLFFRGTGVHRSFRPTNIAVWKPSVEITSSGKFNYVIPTSAYLFDGCSLEYWQIGGNLEFNASWDFVFVEGSGVGATLRSEDFGETL